MVTRARGRDGNGEMERERWRGRDGEGEKRIKKQTNNHLQPK